MPPPSGPHLEARIASNVAAVHARMDGARLRSPHAAARTTLVAVTKSAPPDWYGPLARAGVADVGENRVLDAQRRKAKAPPGLRWHGIGHLQRNKIPEALATFDVFHALDSLRLARALERALASAQRRWPVFVQVNASGEAQKGGLDPDEAPPLLEQILAGCPHLEVTGWMTMAAFGASEGDLRRTFRTLRALRDEVRSRGLGDPPPSELSMGMSDDFEIAIEEGATVVRVGRALFVGASSERGTPQGEAGDAA